MLSSRDFIEVYTSTLNQQKKIIKTNAYARELELKYHKKHHQRFKQRKNSATYGQGTVSQWPIESNVFTQVLKAKLQNIPIQTPMLTDYSKKLIKELKNSINLRFQSEDVTFPRLDKTRFWSPPKLQNHGFHSSDFDNHKEFGPTAMQIKYSIKNKY